jgi:hypothetical protein
MTKLGCGTSRNWSASRPRVKMPTCDNYTGNDLYPAGSSACTARPERPGEDGSRVGVIPAHELPVPPRIGLVPGCLMWGQRGGCSIRRCPGTRACRPHRHIGHGSATRPLECSEPMTFTRPSEVTRATSAAPSTARPTVIPAVRCAGTGSSSERASTVTSMPGQADHNGPTTAWPGSQRDYHRQAHRPRARASPHYMRQS